MPAYSEVLPRDVDIRSRFTRNIPLNIPVVSAAMDTVTGADLAIAIAQQGGIGVIHKNQSIAEQARGATGEAQRERHDHRSGEAARRSHGR